MDEVNAKPVDLGAVLREGVDASFEPAPVILVAPVGDQRLSLLEGYALRPVATVSRSGHRVDASRRLRSSIALCGTDT